MSGHSQGAGRIRAGLVYGYVTADKYFSHDEQVTNDDDYRMAMHLLSLTAGFDAPWGTGLTVQVPYAEVTYSRRFIAPLTDSGTGDMEFRLRQDLHPLFGWRRGPRVGLTLGTAAPTGRYIEKKPFSPFDPISTDAYAALDTRVARDLSIGRGIWWGLAEAEVSWAVLDRVGLYSLGHDLVTGTPGASDGIVVHANVAARVPLGQAADAFEWGSELRYGAGARYSLWPGLLQASIAAELQRRDAGSQIVQGDRVKFANGGTWLNVTPSLVVLLGQSFAFSGSLRLPMYRDVMGKQGVQDTGVFLAFSGQLTPEFLRSTPAVQPSPVAPAAVPLASPATATSAYEPEITALLVPGTFTIVDYWATWCEPCGRLTTRLAEALHDRPDVAVRRFDATEWSPADWKRFLPDAPGLPVLDLFDPDGRRVARLSGQAAFDFEPHLPPRAPAVAP